MDPDVCLERILELANHFIEEGDGDLDEVGEMAELVLALNGWIKGGGFLPTEWRNEG